MTNVDNAKALRPPRPKPMNFIVSRLYPRSKQL
jgi:hypothetical protein